MTFTLFRIYSIRAATGLIALSALTLSGCAAGNQTDSETTTVRIGDLNTANTLTAGQANDVIADSLDEHGYEVSWHGPFMAFAPAAEAAAADQIDVSSGGTTNFFTALASGEEIVLFGLETNTQGILATKESGITDIEDLPGARVATGRGGTGEYLLNRALEHADIDPETVEFVNVTPEDAATAFEAGDVDAWATYDQYFATAELREGTTVIAPGEEINSLNRSFHWVTRDFYEEHPEAVAALAEGLERSSNAVTENPDLLLELYRDLGAREQVLDRLAAYDVPSFQTANAEMVEELETLGAELVEYGMIDEVPEIEAHIATEFSE